MTVATALAEARERIAMRAAAKPLSAGKSLKHRLALGIDFATVELGALVLVAYDFIGLIHFRKSLLRLRIVLILIRVVLLGQLAKGRFYFFGLRRFGDAQHAIGIAHIVPLSGKKAVKPMDRLVFTANMRIQPQKFQPHTA